MKTYKVQKKVKKENIAKWHTVYEREFLTQAQELFNMCREKMTSGEWIRLITSEDEVLNECQTL